MQKGEIGCFHKQYLSGDNTPCLVHHMSPDPGTASPAGSPALMGQDRTLSGHEVPGGKVVQLLGKSAEHLLIRPATSQRCGHKSSFK